MEVKHFHDYLYSDFFHAYPIKKAMKKVVNSVDGMSNINISMLLNWAVKNLKKDEFFLEIGSYKGRTAIASLIGNKNSRVITVDNCDENFSYCKKNIKKFKFQNQINSILGDWLYSIDLIQNYLNNSKIGVFYYDGEHTLVEQVLSFLLIRKFLSPKSIIIIDDTSALGVHHAINLLVFSFSSLKILHVLDDDEGYWYPNKKYNQEKKWNGVIVLSYDNTLNKKFYLRKIFLFIFLIINSFHEKKLIRTMRAIFKIL